MTHAALPPIGLRTLWIVGLGLAVLPGTTAAQSRLTIQQVPNGTVLTCPVASRDCRFTVRVVDERGAGVGGARVRWSVPGRSVTPRVGTTDVQGYAVASNLLSAGLPPAAARRPDYRVTLRQRATLDGTARHVDFTFRQTLDPAARRDAERRADADARRWSDLADATAEASRRQSEAAAEAQRQADARDADATVEQGGATSAPARVRIGGEGVRPPRREVTPAEHDRLGMDAFRRGDLDEALRRWRAAADGGHVAAALRLGDMHYYGRQVARDPRQALVWYRRGAALESARAMGMVGQILERGEGTAANRREAIRWYREGARRGDALSRAALRRLGVPLTEPPVRPTPSPSPTPQPQPDPTPPVRPPLRRECTYLWSNEQFQRPNVIITERAIQLALGPYTQRAQLRHVSSGAIRLYGAGPASIEPGEYVLSLHGVAVAGTPRRDPIYACVSYR